LDEVLLDDQAGYTLIRRIQNRDREPNNLFVVTGFLAREQLVPVHIDLGDILTIDE
jgi:hypothetical protein